MSVESLSEKNLPWLFYTALRKIKTVASSATFNPVGASAGNPWQSTTSPSSRSNKKTIVLTADSFHGNVIDFLTLAERLRCEGFEILLCTLDARTQKNIFLPFTEETGAAPLMELASFNEARDYKTLAQQVAKDRLVILDEDKCDQMSVYLYEKKRILGTTAIATDMTLRFHCANTESLESLLKLQIALERLTDEKEAIQFIEENKNQFPSILHIESLLSVARSDAVIKKLFEVGIQRGFIKSHFLRYSLESRFHRSTEWAKALLELWKGKSDGYVLCIQLTACPDEASQVIRNSADFEDVSGIDEALKLCETEDLQKELIDVHVNRIPADKLCACLSACKTEELQKILVEKYKNNLPHWCLSQSLHACRTEEIRQNLIEKYGDNISDRLLGSCLSDLSTFSRTRNYAAFRAISYSTGDK